MLKRIVSGIMLTLLLVSILSFAVNVEPVDSVAPVFISKEKHFTLSFPKPKVTKTGSYDWLKMENCSYITKPGHPMLPVRSLVVKLPERSTVSNVRVKVKEVLLQGSFQVLPAPTPTIVGSQTPGKIREDPAIYKAKSPFPKEWHVYREAHGMDVETGKRVKYVILNLFPLRFLPAEHTVVRAEEVAVTVTYTASLEIQSPLTELRNIIITSPSLESYAVELAEWKNNTGVPSKVLNTTWIYSTYSGIDSQEKIRNCIKDFVATYEIVYVTIFGDADRVPVRYAYVPDGEDTYTPTDLYYADLDGTWDDNGDGLYADQRYDDVDGIPDVYIGRIPPSLAGYAQVAVDKIKGYQQQFNSSQDWTKRIVLAAGTCSGDGFTNLDKNGTTILKEYIANIVSDKDIVKLYATAGNLSTASMTFELNKGALFVNFAGHGDPGTGLFPAGWLFYWMIPGIMWNCFLISHVQALTNGFKLPVATTMACSTARFDDADCIGEWFVLEPDGGSIAYFGATRVAYGWLDEWAPYGFMGEMDRRIYEAFYEGYTKLGQMWGESVREYVQSHVWNYEYASVHNVKTFMEFILFGDPTLRIYNGPETLNVPDEYATIQGAVNAAYDGDRIEVAPGTYFENVVVNKTVSLIGQNRDMTIIDGGGVDNVVEVTADNVTITGFTLRNSDDGIYVAGSTGIDISRNHVMNNGVGINLDCSHNIAISGNNIADNSVGIFFAESYDNAIFGNNITRNNWGTDGSSCGWIGEMYGNNITANGWGHGGAGIGLGRRCGMTIRGNVIADNWCGIGSGEEAWDYRCTVYENILMNNYYGVSFAYCGAHVYHNNFVNNTHMNILDIYTSCTWDDGYPSGGNYWSDFSEQYPGVGDIYSGPHQDEVGGDGMWDHPYVIDENNQDGYPLVNPWTPTQPVEALVIRGLTSGISYRTYNGSWGGWTRLPGSTSDRPAAATLRRMTTTNVTSWTNGFEEGDFSEWSGVNEGVGCSADILTADPHDESYHASFSTASDRGAYIRKYFDESTSSVYIRAYVKPKGRDAGAWTWVLAFGRNNLGVAAVIWDTHGYWSLSYRDGGTWHSADSTVTATNDVWYLIELYHKSGSGDGEDKLWVNGNLEVSMSGLDNDDRGDPAYAMAGKIYGTDDGNPVVYIDSVTLTYETTKLTTTTTTALHVVVRGADGKSLWHSYTNLTDNSFSGWTKIPGQTPSAPTLTTDGYKLYLVVRGLNDRIYYNVWNRDWNGWALIPSGLTTDSPAAAVLDGALHIVVRGKNANTLYHGSVNLTVSSFAGWTRISGQTPSAPTLTSDGSNLYLVVRGMNDRIYYKVWRLSWWSGWTLISSGSTTDSPAAAVLDGVLQIVVRGKNANTLWYCEVNLADDNFSGWTRLSGQTLSAPTLTNYVCTRIPGDRYLFEDGFESGDFSAWDGTSANSGWMNVISAEPFQGSYHANFSTVSNGYAFAYKDFTAESSVYLRAYVRPKDLSSGAFNWALTLGNKTHPSRIMSLVRWSSNGYWTLGYRNNSAWGYQDSSILVSNDVWYCIELYHKSGSGDGENKLWINGVLEVSLTGLNNSDRGNPNSIRVGKVGGTDDGSPVVYIDSVVLGTSHIGT